GRGEHEEIHVHRVCVNEKNGGHAPQLRPWRGQMKNYLNQPADDTALPVQKEKRDDADQWRKQQWGRGESAKNAARPEIVAMEDECEWHADDSGQKDRNDRNKQAVSQGLASGWRCEESNIWFDGDVPLRQKTVQKREHVWIQDSDNKDKKDEDGNHC